MRLVVSWLRDFVEIKASPEEIAETLGLRGFEVASVEPLPNHETHPNEADAVIDLEITANRPDCLSVMGLAREVATAFQIPWAPSHVTNVAGVPPGDSDRLRVTIEDEQLGPRYIGAVADITRAASPPWMTSRLQAAGVRPISAIVDITNYVLIERGHPMHAFDLATLAGGEVKVRRAKKGETIKTLDGIDRTLDDEMLVIADRDRAQAVAGVMGGAHSEVGAATKAIVFESAYFKPASVRRTSKRLGLKTEASTRFERGADVNGALPAMQRAIALMEFVGAGKVSGPIVDRYPHPRRASRLHLRRDRLASLLGALVPDADVVRILEGLGLDVTATADGWDVVVPTVRVDLLREVDLIEEVGRHHGFDRLAATFPALTWPAPAPDPRVARDQLLRRILTAAGLSEAVTFGFVEAKAAALFDGAPGVVSIANPLSATFDTLRPLLAGGLVDAVAHNRRHGRRDVGLFEIGTRFTARGETRGVAVAWTGAASTHWAGGSRDVDFFDLKGVLERIGDAFGVPLQFTPSTRPFLVAGRTADVTAAGATLGYAGLLAPAVADTRGAPKQDFIFVAELDLDALTAGAGVRSDAVRPLPKHPFVVRDLSIVVDDTLPAEIIRGTIRAATEGDVGVVAPLVDVGIFDRYHGKGVPDGKVSISLRFTFQAPQRTLTDAEVQRSFDQVVAALAREHGAVQR
jgi:phenylalanyl-tRNA synthetase beta chain